jgi:hypothetical protein
MPGSYSKDLREHVLMAVEAGESPKAVRSGSWLATPRSTAAWPPRAQADERRPETSDPR